MKVIILAAGVGSRLKGLTEDCPKALVKVQGKPILQQQLEVLTKLGLTNISIVIGYKGNQIKTYVTEKWPQLGINFIENDNPLVQGTAYSIWLAKEVIGNDSYLHLHCDMIFDKKIIKDLIKSTHGSAIVLDKKIKVNGKNQRVVVNGERIINMKNNIELDNVAGKAVGIAKISPDNFAHLMLKAKEQFNLGNLKQSYYSLIGKSVNEKEFYVIDAKDHKLIEINTLEHLNMAERGLTRNEY